MFEVNNRNARTICKICLKLTIKTSRRRHEDTRMTSMTSLRCLYDVALVYLLLTLSRFHILLRCFHCCLWTSKWWLICKTSQSSMRKGPSSSHQWNTFPGVNYMFKFNNRNRTSFQICSKLTAKAPEWHQWLYC